MRLLCCEIFLNLKSCGSQEKTDKRYALVTMCIGVGQGYAAVIENAGL